MRLVTETITPAEAEAILIRSANQRQRPLVQSRVRALARAIQDDQWRLTHQPIAIDKDGVLIDGQHRLAAVAMAGLNVKMLVARGVEPDTFDVIDTGRSRTPASTLSIAGYTNTNILAASARYYLVYKDLLGTAKAPSGEPKNKYTPHDILRLMESKPGERIRGAMTPATRISVAVGRHGIVTWLSAALALLDETGVDVELRSEFLEKLESGTMLDAGSPLLAFRRWLVSDTGYARMARGYAGYAGIAIFIKTWNAWVQGEKMQLAIFRVGIESTPAPLRGHTADHRNQPVDTVDADAGELVSA